MWSSPSIPANVRVDANGERSTQGHAACAWAPREHARLLQSGQSGFACARSALRQARQKLLWPHGTPAQGDEGGGEQERRLGVRMRTRVRVALRAGGSRRAGACTRVRVRACLHVCAE